MKWIICANNIEYMRYAAVAVSTCPPGLEPICVIDFNDLTNCNKAALNGIEIDDYVKRWTAYMTSKGVPVLKHEVSFINVLKEVFSGDSLPIARGAFLRCDIPFICDRLGINDEYVLYTDADVFFPHCKNVDYFISLKPPYLTATVEHDPYNWSLFNSGVMVLNVNGMRSLLPEIIDNIPIYGNICFDQSVLQAVLKNRWTGMLIECNWKPYWELRPSWSSREIILLHMHGPKPFSNPSALGVLKGGAWPYWMDVFHWLLKKIDL